MRQAPEPGAQAAAAVADLAGRLGVAEAEVAVRRVLAVTWRSTALGCPRPGTLYAQVLTEGTLIELEVAGRRYEYHAARDRRPFLCEHPEPPAASSG